MKQYILIDHAGRVFVDSSRFFHGDEISYYMHEALVLSLRDAEALKIQLGDSAWNVYNKITNEYINRG